jgi:beta-N-acetylhexosaminidase
MVRGLSQAGIIPVAKHFPGGLGRVGEDPHQTLPKLTVSKQQLEEDLAPFRAVIAAQVPAIMVTHILYPEIDEMPASASQIFMTDLLRNQLGFTGLVVVDDLSMKAVTGTYEVGEYAVKSVNAGADLLLVSDFIDYETIRSALIAATERGELKRDRLLEAQVRVEQFRH